MDDPRQYSDPSQLNIPYDVVKLPSKGMFYSSKISELKVTYLTASDENVLSSTAIAQSGRMVDELLRRKIFGSDLPITEMLDCDKQAVLIFLRNTAYGPIYTFKLTDPKTGDVFDYDHDLSNVEMKEFSLVPNAEGEFEYTLPMSGKIVNFKFLSSSQEQELTTLAETYKGGIVPIATKRLELLIHQIDGERDKSKISQMIQTMPIKDSQEFKKFVNLSSPGLNLKVKTKAPGGGDITTSIVMGADFFRPFFGL
jgi:hypothetical protein